MRKFFRIVFIFLVSVVVGTFTFLVIVYFRPTLLLNEKNLHRLTDYLAENKAVFLKWESASIDVKNLGLTSKRIDIHFHSFCFDLKKEEAKGCFSEIILGGEVSLSLEGVEISELSPLKVVGESLTYSGIEFTEIQLREKKELNGLDLSFKLQVLGTPKTASIQLSLDQKSVRSDLWTGVLAGSAENWSSVIPKAEVDKCQFNFPNPLLEVGNFFIDCKIKGVKPNQAAAAKLFLEGRWTKPLLSGFEEGFPFSQLSGNLRFEEFSSIVQFLANTSYFVPRPFNSLTGNVELDLQLLHPGVRENQLVVALRTRLNSRNQVFNTMSQAEVSFEGEKRPLKLTTTINFEDVQLVLPELEILTLPQMVVDKRFIDEESARKVASASVAPEIEYEIVLNADQKRPIRFLTSLSKIPIPVYGNFRFRSTGLPQGKLSVKKVPIEIFRHVATIEHLELEYREKTKTYDVQSKLQVDYNYYKVFIEFLGDIEKPQVIFSSNPPLPKSKILSLLVFGKPMEDLNSDQMSSVSNLEGAITDGAVSLLSFYALASTPIERVGYNSSTKQYSAELRIGEGSTLVVGSDFENLHTVGIKRALGGNWWLQTYVNQNVNLDQKNVTALLEWIKRF